MHMSGRLGPAAATSGTLAGCIVAAGRQGRNTSPARRDSRADGVFEMRLSRAPRPEEVARSRNTGVEREFGAVSINSPHPPPHLHSSTAPQLHTTPLLHGGTRCSRGAFSAHLQPRLPLSATPAPTLDNPHVSSSRPRAVSEWLACLGADHEHMRATDGDSKTATGGHLPTYEQETHSQHSTHVRAVCPVWPSSTLERGVVWLGLATPLHSIPLGSEYLDAAG